MQPTDPPGPGQGTGTSKRPPNNPGTRPRGAPPRLDRGTKDAIGRALNVTLRPMEKAAVDIETKLGLGSADNGDANV